MQKFESPENDIFKSSLYFSTTEPVLVTKAIR